MADANNHISYTLTDIQRYLQGSMSAKEMHELERAALEDPFLVDALEGYSEADMQQAEQHLTEIETAILPQEKKSKIVTLPPMKINRSWQVAASVIILIGIGGVSYFIFNKKTIDAPLTKVEGRSTMPATDSAQIRVQTVSPPTKNSTASAKKEREGKEEGNPSLIAANNKKELQMPGVESPVPKSAMKRGGNKARLNAPGIMTKQDSIDETASIITDNQQQLAGTELKTSIHDHNDEVVISYSSKKKHKGKAGLSASSDMAMKTLNNEIAGTIIDNHQQPVPNATIILQDSTQAITDKSGNFSIATTDSNAEVSITAFGYKTINNQQLRRGRNRIILKERPFLLSDVEVINLGTAGRKKADTTAAMPQGGWQPFQEYVYQKLHRKYDSTAITNAYLGGDLQLEFSISEDGDPIDFKVLHAPDSQTANEAISAIIAGPRWINRDKRSKMRVTVRYK